ncbi:MAG: hypothetical protein K0Q79_3609 [Flavipsychrobacter sp.]|jgi:TPR repeat protein|nr:hypothetical protein [Flavipsychrobacter sp.]
MRFFFLFLSVFYACSVYAQKEKRILGYGTANLTGGAQPHVAKVLSTQGIQGKCGDKVISCGGPSFSELSVFYSVYAHNGGLSVEFSKPFYFSNNRIYYNNKPTELTGFNDVAFVNTLSRADERAEIIVEYEVYFGDKKLHEGKLVLTDGKNGKCFTTEKAYSIINVETLTIPILMSTLSTQERERITNSDAKAASVYLKKGYVYRWEGENKFDICNDIACRGAGGKDKNKDNSSNSDNSNSGSSKSNKSSGSTTTRSSAYEDFKSQLNWNKWSMTIANNPDEDGLTTNLKDAQQMLLQEWGLLPASSELNTNYCSSVKYKMHTGEFNTNGKCSISYTFVDASELNCNQIHYKKIPPYRTKYTYEFDMKNIEKIGYIIQDHPTPDNNVAKLFGLVFFSNGSRIKETTTSYLGSERLSGPEVKMVSKTEYMFLDECKATNCGGLNNELYKRMNHFRLKVRNYEKERNEDPYFWGNERISTQSSEDLKARAEFDVAEQTYEDGNYSSALQHLSTAENLLGSWNAKIGYLRVMILDKIADPNKPDSLLFELKTELQRYLSYASGNNGYLDRQKFNKVNAIEQKLAMVKMYEDAQAALSSKNYEKALELFEKTAEGGNDNAMAILGMMYLNGAGTKKDYSRAIIWFKKSAEKGNVNAMGQLGELYFKGNDDPASPSNNIPQDYKQALDWYTKAAVGDSKHAIAMSNVGAMYQFGLGATQNYSAALIWYEKALKAGAKESDLSASIAKCYEGNQVYWQALAWYIKAYNYGDKSVKNIIAAYYWEGKGVDKNRQKAKEWQSK